MAVPVSVAFV